MFVVIYFQDHYELCAFIEYVGRIPRNPEKKELVAHYISYKSLMGEWVRNDDNLAHIAQIDGEYKVNLIFYRAMINAPQAMFYVDTTTLRPWTKSVVIRGVYKGNGQGGRRGCGRGQARTTASNKQDDSADKYMIDESSSSESDKNTGTLYLLNNILSIINHSHDIVLNSSIVSLCLQINLTA